MISNQLSGKAETGEIMGIHLAQNLKAQGADEILAALESTNS
jgi:hydroxymethylbilane synthase